MKIHPTLFSAKVCDTKQSLLAPKQTRQHSRELKRRFVFDNVTFGSFIEGKTRKFEFSPKYELFRTRICLKATTNSVFDLRYEGFLKWLSINHDPQCGGISPYKRHGHFNVFSGDIKHNFKIPPAKHNHLISAFFSIWQLSYFSNYEEFITEHMEYFIIGQLRISEDQINKLFKNRDKCGKSQIPEQIKVKNSHTKSNISVHMDFR